MERVCSCPRGWSARFDLGDEFHLRPAAFAAGDGRKDRGGRGLVEFAANQGAHEQADFAGRAAHPAMVAHPDKALGQDVQAPASQKLLGSEADDERPVGAALVALEADASLPVVAEESSRSEGRFEDVAGEKRRGTEAFWTERSEAPEG